MGPNAYASSLAPAEAAPAVEEGEAPVDEAEPVSDEGGDEGAEQDEDESEGVEAEREGVEPEREAAPAAATVEEPEPSPSVAPAESGPGRFERRRQERSTEDRILLGGGIAALSLGVVVSVPMVVGLASGAEIESMLADYPSDPTSPSDVRARQEEQRADLIRQGRFMNRLALGTGIAAGVYITGGLVLIGLALTGNRRSNRRASITPSFGREHAGLLLQGRF